MYSGYHLRMIILWVWSFPVTLTQYQSIVTLSSKGMQFSPANSIELLSTTAEKSLVRCLRLCSQNPQCRTLDYDAQSNQCRLFEGAVSTGQLVVSSSLLSQVGSVKLDASFYTAYGLSCNYCQTNRYLLCINQLCACPQNTYWDGSMCVNQKYAGASCTLQDECRSNSLNLACPPETCPTTGISRICSVGVNLIPFKLTMNYGFPYTLYAYNFTAVYSNALITVAISRISWNWNFDEFSLKTSNGSELLINGGFEMGSTAHWTYCNPYSSSWAGSVRNAVGRNFSGTYYWQDAAGPAPDFLVQNVSLTVGNTYTFSFWLMADAGGGQVLISIFQK